MNANSLPNPTHRGDCFDAARRLLDEPAGILASIMESMGDGLSIQDLSMRIVYQNRFMIDNFGSHVGDYCYNIYEKRSTACEGCPIIEAYRTGHTTKALRVGITRNGVPFRFENIASVLRDTQGEIVAGIELCRIVEERERAFDELREATTKMEAMHKRLLDLSRKAGMAEIASGVLHNVGNALNSVNVSAELAMERIRQSKVPGLSKVAALVREHETDLGVFMAEDTRGRRIPEYLSNLATCLASEQQAITEELHSLASGIEHIKTIVKMQQAYATGSSVLESVTVDSLIDDALRLDAMSFTRHRIEVVRQYDQVPPLLCDRQRLLQILVNLIGNAKDALRDGREDPRQLTVRVGRPGQDHVRLQVSDNGCGIPPEHMSQIFRHGFTTKKNGHGFGLHNSALMAKQMGGSLSVSSDGAGKGATFSLELPIEPTADSKEVDSHVATP